MICSMFMTFLFLILTSVQSFAEAEKLPALRMGTAASAPLPFADFVSENGKILVVQGINLDISRELAKVLGLPVEVRTVPRVRVGQELEKGNIDFVCNYRSSWLKGDFLFVEDVFQNGDMIVWLNETKPIKSLKELEGVRLATAKGYSHPEVEVALGKKFKRVDYDDMSSAVKMLLIKEVDYVIFNRINFDFMSSIKLYAGKITTTPLEVSKYRTGCAISQKSRIEPMKIKIALESMVKNGAIRKILKSYGLESAAVGGTAVKP